MAILDLGQLDWRLFGWRPNQWDLGQSMETGTTFNADLGPFPARVPGSVQQTLLDAGVLPDWHVGVNSRACEWVEHRCWQYTAIIPVGFVPKGERAVLHSEGLDYSGIIVVDAKRVGAFEGVLIPSGFDLTSHLNDGEEHRLTVLFLEPPAEQGQLGYTSRSKYFKPRYDYSWDWVPRIVPIGFWGPLTLRTGLDAGIRNVTFRTTLGVDNATGALDVEAVLDEAAAQTLTGGVMETRLLDNGTIVAESSTPLDGALRLTSAIAGIPVEPWWPNGMGAQKLYELSITLRAANGEVWRCERQAGFKRVEWRACEGYPNDLPWICVVNGTPVFIQGANWTPLQATYQDIKDSDYQRTLGLYREMGCNLMRVWGGGFLETAFFYEQCDRLGLMVWQEFPLSSSGIDNVPPEAPESIAKLEAIAASYIDRRAHHASLLLWCGGNELTTLETIPITAAHPCIAAMKAVVNRLDPGHRFIPTSPSGPLFYAQKDTFGKGQHVHVHGPWGLMSWTGLDEWRDYFENDDAGFRSECGMPGAMSLEMFRKYAGGMQVWPVEGEYWKHTSAWWMQWGIYGPKLGHLSEAEGLPEYIRQTQEQQAEAYRIAASACKRRFPACGGFIIWMGHDTFPCASNNAVIDYDRNPKPAYFALREVFRGQGA